MKATITINTEAGGLRVAGEVNGRPLDVLVGVSIEPAHRVTVQLGGRQVGAFGAYYRLANAERVAHEVALALAMGEALAHLHGETEPAPGGLRRPYARECVDYTQRATRRLVKLLGRDALADEHVEGET